MQENETPKVKADLRKEKIRAKYRGLCADDVEYIPPIETKNFFDDDTYKRVGIYARVSTDASNQTSSFELQKSHYEELVKCHPGWDLIDLYADEGISGTSLKNRDQFVRLINDCKAGRIDLVVVKSVSRFARNIVHCLDYVRQLADLRPPIGVFFEIERIYTLNDNSETSLNFSAYLAQEESRHKSILLKDAYVKRSRYGIVWTPELLGYDLDEDGNLVINEEEAQTVRLIFFMYLYGYTCARIAETLMSLGLRTNKRDPDTGEYNLKWSAGTVLTILQNERHCGEILTQKTWTPNFLTHKSIKNRQHLPQYRKRNHHEPIISRDDFIAVQRLISNAKYGRGILPELKVIMEGALCGFVSLNPRWAAFSANDYKAASLSAFKGEEKFEEKQIEIEGKSGEFDLRGYEVVRSQFFNTADKKCITFSTEHLWFGVECLRKLNNVMYVEILIHPIEQLLAVRPCAKEYRNTVRWAKIEGDKYAPRQITGAAFLKTLYEIFGWDNDCRYRVSGVRRQRGNDSVIVFDMRETEIFIPPEALKTDPTALENSIGAAKRKITAFPQAWTADFGSEYYRQQQAREIRAMDKEGKWGLAENGQPYREEGALNVTSETDLADNIKNIMDGIEQGATDDGN